jgi:hypothetical protein
MYLNQKEKSGSGRNPDHDPADGKKIQNCGLSFSWQIPGIHLQ